MAYYRQIYTTFWTDAKVADDFTPEDKYFYLYLLTNAHTNLCGCYEISKKQISVDTGYTVDTVTRLLDRMENIHGIVCYSEETKEVYLVNWYKYNWSKSEKVLKGVASEVERVKCVPFQQRIIHLLEQFGYHIDTLCIPYAYPMDTSVSVTVTDTVSDTVTVTPENATDIAFDEFWNEYPRKVGKKDARRAYEKALKSTDSETMIRAVTAQRSSGQWTRDGGKYIPNPATWLNQGRWDDEIQPKEKPPKQKTAPSESHTYTAEQMAELRRRAKE